MATVNGVHPLIAFFGAIAAALGMAALGDWRTRRARAAKAEADRRFLEGRRNQ